MQEGAPSFTCSCSIVNGGSVFHYSVDIRAPSVLRRQHGHDLAGGIGVVSAHAPFMPCLLLFSERLVRGRRALAALFPAGYGPQRQRRAGLGVWLAHAQVCKRSVTEGARACQLQENRCLQPLLARTAAGRQE